MDKCKKHPRYKGKNVPTSNCIACWKIFANEQKIQAMHERSKTKVYKKERDGLLKQYVEVNNLVERMEDIISTVEPVGKFTPIKHTGEQEEEELIALFSDSQIGTKSLGEEIGLMQPMVYGPLGTYNFNIFRYRLRLWTGAITKIASMQRKTMPLKKLNLWFLGDIIENEWIFKGQGAYIETGVLQQFFASLQEVGRAIAGLAKEFEIIEIRAVAGNHGRGVPHTHGTKTWVNWEWLWYRYLELTCRDLPNVKFNLVMSWFDIPEVQGWNGKGIQ